MREQPPENKKSRPATNPKDTKEKVRAALPEPLLGAPPKVN